MDDGDAWPDLLDREQVGGPHVHGHGLESSAGGAKAPQEGHDRSSAAALRGMNDLPSLEVEDDRHVLVTFAGCELVDGDQPNPSKRPLLEPCWFRKIWPV